MDIHSEAIFIHKKKYLDNYIFIFYTKNNGLIEFFINTVYKNKLLNSLKPLSIVNLTFYNKNSYFKYKNHENDNLTMSIYEDFNKSCVTFFLADFINNVCEKNNSNFKFFDFLKNSVLILETTDRSISNFHICFMIKSLRFLGLDLVLKKEDLYLDLKEGVSTKITPKNSDYINQDEKNIIINLRNCKLSECHDIKINKIKRKKTIINLIKFYNLHLENFNKINSHEILEELFN